MCFFHFRKILFFLKIIALRERQSALQDSLHRVRDHDIASQNVDERIRLEKDLKDVKERLSNYDHTILSTQSQISVITSTGDRSSVFICSIKMYFTIIHIIPFYS